MSIGGHIPTHTSSAPCACAAALSSIISIQRAHFSCLTVISFRMSSPPELCSLFVSLKVSKLDTVLYSTVGSLSLGIEGRWLPLNILLHCGVCLLAYPSARAFPRSVWRNVMHVVVMT